MKIGVFSAAFGEAYRESVLQCINNHQQYCDRHRYYYQCYTENEIDPDKRHPSWTKLQIVHEAMHIFDYVFWLDADTLVMNHQKPLRIFTDTDWIFSVDQYCSVCMGVWGVRGKTSGVIDRRNRLMDWYFSKVNDSRWWEQRAVCDDLPPSDEISIDWSLAGLYNDLPIENVARQVCMKHGAILTDRLLNDVKMQCRRVCFDPGYHHICHFAGRAIENKSLKQSVEKMLPKVRY